MKIITEGNIEAINRLPAMVESYKNNEIDLTRFKAFRVPLGVYEQRKKETYMVRTRIPGGVFDLEQLEKIVEIANKYSKGKIHLTTRQDIQLHDVLIDDIEKSINELKDINIATLGTGGNTIRNIACSPLAGVTPAEPYDITPYVIAFTEEIIKDKSTLNLPRKYKISFSNSLEDTANATISDLGFIATIKDGKNGFVVYGAGGLGGNATVSIKLSDFIEIDEVFYYIVAMKILFENEGDRSNKHQARIRYILHRHGEDKFKELFNEILAKVKNENSFKFDFEISDKKYEEVKEEVKINKINVFEQKQSGYYSVYIHPVSGNLYSNDLDNLITYLKSLDYKVSLRLTNTQGFFVRDIKGSDVEGILNITKGISSPYDLYNSVTCAGSSTCQLGLCLSQNLLKGIVERFKDETEEVKAVLPRLFISGCPNSCGQHQKGVIGFSGRAKRSEYGLLPTYSLLVGGKVGEKAKLGENLSDIPAKKIPDFLLNLSKEIINSNKKSEEFINENLSDIKALVSKFSTIESLEENPDLYFDFYSEEIFSLKDRGAGECSVGVLDVINLDINKADGFFGEYEKNKNPEEMFKAVISSSRALLILKDAYSEKPREIFEAFTKHFIDEGYVKTEIKEVFSKLIDYKLGDIKSLEAIEEDTVYLLNKVKEMKASLTPNLSIGIKKERESKEKPKDEKQETNIVDLRGVKCPINFVKAKIHLASIKSNETLGIYLDDGEPINNVPKSLEKEGHTIVEIDDKFSGYNLIVVKKK